MNRLLCELTVALASFVASPLWADTNEQAPSESLIEDGGYFEAGIGVFLYTPIREINADDTTDANAFSGAGLSLAGAWRRGPVFFEARRSDVNGLSLGATLWHDEKHVLDLLGAHPPVTFE